MIQIDSFAYANNPFSTHGDSGSLIVTRDDNKAIGLLWGCWQEKLRSGFAQENWTYGIALENWTYGKFRAFRTVLLN